VARGNYEGKAAYFVGLQKGSASGMRPIQRVRCERQEARGEVNLGTT